MASVTYDDQSFMIDGRRILIVGGQIDYARTPREHWADRIQAAKVAGLNTVATSVPWALHEPRTGQFDFEGPLDIRQFVRLVHEAGLYCVLRAGPYIGSGWDMGGLPHWLINKPDIVFRAPNAPFLDAAGKFITALAEQVADLQITSIGEGGPIIMLQNEARWVCGDEIAAIGYLGELARYYREAGFNVPSVNANNLWQGTEGEIDGWVGEADMLATLRQLAAVNPDAPRIITDMATTHDPVIGRDPPATVSPIALQRRLAEVLAGGGQYIMSPFAAGLTPGFLAGRPGGRTDEFAHSAFGAGAPVDGAGAPGATYSHVRRLCGFASSFAKVFASLNQSYRPTLLDQRAPAGTSDSTSLVDLRGSQGDVTFVFAEEPPEGKTPRPRDVDIMLSEGSSLTVPLGRQAVSWVLFNVLLSRSATLDFCTLNAFSTIGQVFVCYGPAGATGSVSINGTVLTADVPKGKTPAIHELEGFTVIIANEDQIDAIHTADDIVYIGVAGVDAQGVPVALPGAKQCIAYTLTGEKQKISFQETVPARAATAAVALPDWHAVTADEHVLGTSQRFAPIDGPGDLAELGAPFGYGWYKIDIKSASARKPKLLAPASRDRLHVFLDGEDQGVMGFGPGADFEPMQLPLKKGDHTITVLAENLGRPSTGLSLDEPKGLLDHLFEVKPFRAGRHKIELGSPIDLLGFKTPLWNVRPGDVTRPERLTWTFMHRKKSPVIISIGELAHKLVLVINDEPVRYLDAAGPTRIVLDQQTLSRGKNVLQLALHDDAADATQTLESIAAQTTILEGVEELTGKGKWSYARWEPPAASSYKAASKSKLASLKGPTWYRTEFEIKADGAPVRLDLAGLSKGQVMLNGHHVARYFNHTKSGAIVDAEPTLLLPGPALKPDAANELIIFDEHGSSPAKTRLLIERGTHPFTA
ncbi:MAG: beta-galactosidase [Planctomycetota bacterium]